MTEETLTFRDDLIQARAKINAGLNIFICQALMTDVHRKRIEDMLYPNYCYESWLDTHHHGTFLQMLKTPGAFRYGRLQWLDYLIKELP